MAAPGALYQALDLAATPILARAMRQQPLPSDVLDLIKIAAGNADACRRAARAAGKRAEFIREAAILYVQQVLLAPDADSYRILGVAADAPHERLREHMRWMMKWAHPDHSRSGWESAFAERVLGAWHELKTPARRQRYDRAIGSQRLAVSVGRRRRSRRRREPARRIPRITGPPSRMVSERWQRRSRWMLAGIAVAVVLAAFLVPDWGSQSRQRLSTRHLGETAAVGSGDVRTGPAGGERRLGGTWP